MDLRARWRADALLRLKESGARFEMAVFERALDSFAREALTDPVQDPQRMDVGHDVAIAVLRTSVDNEVGFGQMAQVQSFAPRGEWVGLGRNRKGMGEGRQVVL